MSLADDILPTDGRVRGATSSPVGDILALTDRPGVISFAGGLPAPELFDVASAGSGAVSGSGVSGLTLACRRRMAGWPRPRPPPSRRRIT